MALTQMPVPTTWSSAGILRSNFDMVQCLLYSYASDVMVRDTES